MRTQYNKACVAYYRWLISCAWQPSLLNDRPPNLIALNVTGLDVAEHSGAFSARSWSMAGSWCGPTVSADTGSGIRSPDIRVSLRSDNKVTGHQRAEGRVGTAVLFRGRRERWASEVPRTPPSPARSAHALASSWKLERASRNVRHGMASWVRPLSNPGDVLASPRRRDHLPSLPRRGASARPGSKPEPGSVQRQLRAACYIASTWLRR